MMFRDAIPNEILDIPRNPALPVRSGTPPAFNLDYANSDDPGEIDTGIRDTIRGIRFSILAMGVGLAKIKRKGLYIDLNYHSMNDYIEKLADDTHMDRSSIFNWMYIGEAFSNYRNDLDKISFTDEDGPTKLLYVDRALAVHTKPEVFGNIKTMSFRKFKDFALANPVEENPPISKIQVSGNQVLIEGKPAVTFSEDMDPKTLAYFSDINARAGEAWAAGEVVVPTRVYDNDEARSFARAADKLLKEMRSKK